LTVSVFTNVSAMSLSVTSAATYQIDGMLMWTTSSTQSVAFGFTYPAGITPGVMEMIANQNLFTAGFGDSFVSTNIQHGFIYDSGISNVATAQLSLSDRSRNGPFRVCMPEFAHN